MVFHKQVIIKAYVNNAPQTDEKVLNSWLTQLVKDIKMKTILPARSKYVDTKNNAGLTGSINIETSHIAIHIWCEESPNLVQLDVYSCKDFDVKTVLKKLKEWDLVRYHYWVIDRNDKEFRILDKDTYHYK
jgi:S-adenosylmethionine/arginine decarboxylase-like enzyme